MKAKLVKREDRWDLYDISTDVKIASSENFEVKNGFYKLSLENCFSIEHDVNINELSEESWNICSNLFPRLSRTLFMAVFKDGFNAHRKAMQEKGLIKNSDVFEWDVEVVMEAENPRPFMIRKVTRILNNGEEVEWKCFWDNGWWCSSSRVSIPNVIDWKREPILDSDQCLILKRIKKCT